MWRHFIHWNSERGWEWGWPPWEKQEEKDRARLAFPKAQGAGWQLELGFWRPGPGSGLALWERQEVGWALCCAVVSAPTPRVLLIFNPTMVIMMIINHAQYDWVSSWQKMRGVGFVFRLALGWNILGWSRDGAVSGKWVWISQLSRGGPRSHPGWCNWEALTMGNHSKHGKCGPAPTQKSQWGARFGGRTHTHG